MCYTINKYIIIINLCIYNNYYKIYKDVKNMHSYIQTYLLVYAYRVQQQKGKLYVTLRQQKKSLL